MKIKDLERTANVAWSPKSQTSICLAAGTAGQQLDASFSTNAALEIYSLNLNEPGPDLLQKAAIPSDQRFNKIVWGEQNGGTIIGACDGGVVNIYSSPKLLRGESGLISRQERHAGNVHSLDFNPFQHNLLASGAGESEIFIWDLNNIATPMSPGAKSQPLEDVLSVAWNRQVQHILSSTFSTKCVIWDLRKEHPIIKLTDTVSRVRWKVVAWHPEVATQLCLASEEDHSPIIQLWDLRFATSPLKTLENHQRGVLSIAWCTADSDLLISCGKDNRILCWNPNSDQQNGEVLSEIAKTTQWNFDVQWCPRNPAIFACPSFDGHVSVYSLMGGKTQQIQTTNKIADSFPGMDGYVEAPLPQTNTTVPVSVDLSKPPKWFRRPVGVRWGFGGKLVWFNNNIHEPQHKQVTIGQVVTEPELVQKSLELEQALELGNFSDYCRDKADSTDDKHKKYIWHFLKANFEENPRVELLNLLGYPIDDVNNKLNQFIGTKLINNVDDLTEQMNNVNRIDSFNQFETMKKPSKKIQNFQIKTGDDSEGLLTKALLLGNVEAAVELCLKSERYADAIIIAMAGGSDLLIRTQNVYLEQCEGYVSSLISALVYEDWSSVINNCDLNSWKEALAATLTHANDDNYPNLCEKLGDRLADDINFHQDSQLCYICAGSFDKLVKSWCGTDIQKSTNDLQELVELVNFLQKSVERRQGRAVNVTGALAELYAYYASLLAAQGKLETALNYLGESQDVKLNELRERLCVNLGQKTIYGGNTQMNNKQQTQSRRGSQRQSFSNYINPTSNYVGQQQQQQQFNQSALQQPWQQMQQQPQLPLPPQTFAPVAPPPTQPPRPTSVGSNHGGSGLPQKKYVLDPSVASNQYGSLKMPYQSAALNQFNPSVGYPQQQQYPQSLSTNQYQQNSSFSNFPPSSVSNVNSSFPSLNSTVHSSFSNNIPQPQVSSSTMNTNLFTPISSQYNNNNNSMSNYIQSASLSSIPPPLDVAQAVNERPQAPSGWNDPPALHKLPKQQQQQQQQAKTELTSSLPTQPITHPLYGNVPQSNNEANPGQYWGNESVSQSFPPTQILQPTSTINTNPLMQQQSVPTMSIQSGFKQNAITPNYGHPPNQQLTSSQQQKQFVDQPQMIEKAPIPDEHIKIQKILNDLRNGCFIAANNPQTKRKLDDVGKKLEMLYDLLREHKLSSTTLGSLHQMIQLIENGDYTGGLSLHTQLVSGPDFAQIASFMPGLKVLMQCSLQLQVYLR